MKQFCLLALAWIGRAFIKATGTGLFSLILALLTGCAGVPVHQQRLVSKPNMLFADSSVFNYYSKLLGQLEPGAGMFGGARATGCTSCK